MRDKLKDWNSDTVVETIQQSTGAGSGNISIHGVMTEVQSALESLGYKSHEASKVVSRLAEEYDFSTTSSSELIRLALKGTLV